MLATDTLVLIADKQAVFSINLLIFDNDYDVRLRAQATIDQIAARHDDTRLEIWGVDEDGYNVTRPYPQT